MIVDIKEVSDYLDSILKEDENIRRLAVGCKDCSEIVDLWLSLVGDISPEEKKEKVAPKSPYLTTPKGVLLNKFPCQRAFDIMNGKIVMKKDKSVNLPKKPVICAKCRFAAKVDTPLFQGTKIIPMIFCSRRQAFFTAKSRVCGFEQPIST